MTYTGNQKLEQLKTMTTFLESLGYNVEGLSLLELEEILIKLSDVLNNFDNLCEK